MKKFTYVGTELELFAQAKNWKKYIKSILEQYIKNDVLEVGAGLGSNTHLLTCSNYKNWLCLEPDIQLFEALESSIKAKNIYNCSAWNQTIDGLKNDQLFDSILYIDVLEHIQDDKEELLKAVHHLKPDGNLIILSPAHQWLFTSFDAAIGHYRRYNKSTLKDVLPNRMKVINLIYLDSVGFLASLGNKLLLKQSYPTLKQLRIWDNFMVPISINIDPIIRYSWGKSILLVACKK